MTDMLRVNDIRQHFCQELLDGNFTTDRTGQKTIELLGASFEANEPAIFGKINQEYIDKEIIWYRMQSTNIKDIYGNERDPPAAWKYAANEYGEINSNYGMLIYSDKYYNQCRQVLMELFRNPDGRRATMVYNRPSIWEEFDENGKNDFICTNAVTYYVRNNRLHAVVQMRSNDVIFGYRNDYAWQKYVLNDLRESLNNLLDQEGFYPISEGKIYWQVQNLHVYERHFDLVRM